MPMYTMICKECEVESVKILPISQRDEAIECEGCGQALQRIIDRPGLVYAPTAGGMR